MRGTSALRVWKRMMSSSVKETTAEGFRQAWLERAPQTQEPPLTPSDYMSSLGKASEETQKEQGKLSFSFMLPHSTLTQDEEVEMVLLPATTGEFGVMAGHVPVIAQLKPGVVAIHKEQDKDVKKYFVSSGFAFVHENSVTEVCAVEAVPLEDLDAEVVRTSLADYTAKVSSATDDYERAVAQVGVDVYSAMNSALGN